jgi:C4-dicarboxylate transporter, DctM subunit
LSPIAIGLIGMLCFVCLVALNIPLAFSFIIVGFIGVIFMKGLGPGLALLGSIPYSLAASYSLSVLPLFILMGQFAFHSGTGKDLYDTAYKWLGRLPGGLALATMLACTGFGACTGSTIAAAATMGSIAFPQMDRFQYSRRLSTAVIATGGTLGILIPPSNMFIIYGIMTETSIAQLFIAGILPGLMLSAMYCTLILIMCLRNPQLGPPGERFSWKEKIVSIFGIWGMLALFVLIIGGLYLGVFTPTEAGAIGSLGALLLLVLRGRLARSVVHDALIDSARTTCYVMFIIVGAMVFNVFLGTCGFGVALGNWVNNLPVSRWLILVFVLLMYVPFGCFMDALSMMLLTLPFIYPIIIKLGFDPIWFGVLMVVLLEMGVLTPPIGLNVFVVTGVTGVPNGEIFRGVTPFILVMCLGLAILVLFPEISLILPRMMR